MRYNNYAVYAAGKRAGYADEDSRSCPFESTELILDWTAGWQDGQALRRERYKE